jgi:hypothetical protein
MKFNVVFPFYLNEGMLAKHLTTWERWPPDLLDHYRFTVVDDCSPRPAEPVIRATNGFKGEIRLYRIERDVPWGWPAAKNIGMWHLPDHEPALLTDIDHLLDAENAERLLDLKICHGCHYIPRRRRAVDGLEYKRHPSTYILRKELYWQVGGFEERWLGLYGTDFMMRKRIQRLSTRVELNEVWLTLYGREVIADASTTCFGRKGSEYHQHPRAMHGAAAGPVQVVLSQPYHRVL